MTNECHKCPFDGKHSEECLKCVMEEYYSIGKTHKGAMRLIDGFQIPEPEKQEPTKVTDLDCNAEDKFRIYLYNLFDLSYNELMILKAIMNGKTLQQFAHDMENLSEKNSNFSRYRAFQTRKSIYKKFPELQNALLTNGQKKKLKDI